MRSLLEAERGLAATAPRVSEILFAAVPKVGERAVRRHLLSLRRRVFQLDDGITAAELGALETGLSGDDRTVVRGFAERLRGLADDRGSIDAMYAHDRRIASDAVEQAVQSPLFQKGLASSSDQLFNHLGRGGEPPRKMSAARSAQRMRGLLRYLSRASMKATPFGTFCQLIGVSLEDVVSPLVLEGNLSPTPSLVRLNKSIYRDLRGVLYPLASVRERLEVSLNETIEIDGDWLRVFALADTREAFVRLRRTPALECVLGVLRRRPQVRLSRLVDAVLGDNQVEATREEATLYVEGLLRCGLLRLISPVDDQVADWGAPFDDFLRGVDDAPKALAAARQMLGAFATQLSIFPTASARGRHAIQKRGLRLAQRYFVDAKASRTIRRTAVFYEDCGAQARLLVDRASFAGALVDLKRYVTESLPLGYTRLEAADAREIFELANPGVPRTSLLAFAEQYSRHRIERNKKEGAAPPPPSGERTATVLQRIRRSRDILTVSLAHAWSMSPHAMEVAVSAEMLRHAVRVAPAPGSGPRSVSLFCNLIPPRGDAEWRVVLNYGRYLAGNGKYLSRFLPILPRDLWIAARDRNAASRHGRIVEIADDGDFNPNLHPRLTDSVIQYPTGSHHARADAIPVADLDVGLDADDPARLSLTRRSTGERVWPVDLGFLNPRMRPPLFRLLRALGPDAQFGLTLPWAPPETPHTAVAPERLTTIVVRPRYTFGEHLILSRRTWHVPAALFPRMVPNESVSEHFVRVQRWRFDAGIPDRAYVRVFAITKKPDQQATATTSGEEQTVDEVEAGLEEESEAVHRTTRETGADKEAPARRPQVSMDASKPQFIDFTNPLFVDLFGRLPGELENFTVAVEEMLPDTLDYPRCGEQSHCTEFVLQMDLDG